MKNGALFEAVNHRDCRTVVKRVPKGVYTISDTDYYISRSLLIKVTEEYSRFTQNWTEKTWDMDEAILAPPRSVLFWRFLVGFLTRKPSRIPKCTSIPK